MTKHTIIKGVLFCFILHSSFQVIAIEKNTGAQLIKVSEYKLNADIVALVELSKNAPDKAEGVLNQLNADETVYNFAEQYLIELTKANLKQAQQQHQAVITLIEQAKPLRKNIIEHQLNTPLFSNAYLVLANSYLALEDYDNAYQAKKTFVDEYNDYSKAKREDTVKALTKKYEIAHKIEENKLLNNQNKLKELRIREVHRKQQAQQQQFIVITGTILVFILLYLRQLKVRKKLLLLTKTDSLTGLLNRSALFKEGQKLVQLSKQQNVELSILLFDIDHFKVINDEYGHNIGDLVLEKIAQLVDETMRSRDIFARLGGEEFVAMLPNTDIDKAKAIAVRVMEKICQFNFAVVGVDTTITLSIGVASSKDANLAFDDLLHSADVAMYQAKAQGGNQMLSFESIDKVEESDRP